VVEWRDERTMTTAEILEEVTELLGRLIDDLREPDGSVHLLGNGPSQG
jgi:hypothetical protein